MRVQSCSRGELLMWSSSLKERLPIDTEPQVRVALSSSRCRPDKQQHGWYCSQPYWQGNRQACSCPQSRALPQGAPRRQLIRKMRKSQTHPSPRPTRVGLAPSVPFGQALCGAVPERGVGTLTGYEIERDPGGKRVQSGTLRRVDSNKFRGSECAFQK